MRVVVAEDVMLTRAGLVHVLTESGVDVVGEARDAQELMREVAASQPDVVIVDIRMPPTHTDEGIVAAQQIARDHPQTAVLVLSQYVEPSYALRLIDERPLGVGYLLKERVFDPALLLDALQRLLDGETVVDPTLVSRLLGRRRRPDRLQRLTDRERAVLALVAEGLSNSAIGSRLSITERTVEAHITGTFQKLGLDSDPGLHRRVLATLTYLRATPEES